LLWHWRPWPTCSFGFRASSAETLRLPKAWEAFILSVRPIKWRKRRNLRDGAKKDRYFAGSETPHDIGRAAALASDPEVMAKSGQTLATWNLALEHDFADLDGTQPHWQKFLETMREKGA
jgi:hypothetical protein